MSAAAEREIPRIPTPSGFIEASGLSDALSRSGASGLAPSAKLLGLYYPTNAVAEILAIGSTPVCPFGKAVMQREFKSVSEAQKAFGTLVTNAKKESSKPFDGNDPVVKRLLKNYEDAASKVAPGTQVKVNGTSVLGTLLETEQVFAISMVINYTVSEGGTEVTMPFAVAHVFTRMDKRQVDVSLAYPFRSASDVSLANQKLLEWLKRIQEANKVSA
jgi:hypothetical protein